MEIISVFMSGIERELGIDEQGNMYDFEIFITETSPYKSNLRFAPNI